MICAVIGFLLDVEAINSQKLEIHVLFVLCAILKAKGRQIIVGIGKEANPSHVLDVRDGEERKLRFIQINAPTWEYSSLILQGSEIIEWLR